MDIRKELEAIQKLADNIRFFAIRILKELPPESKTPIQRLNLSSYAFRRLIIRDIEYIEQMPKTKKGLLGICGIGKKTANEIMEKLKMFGL